jgi:hypothetical protein
MQAEFDPNRETEEAFRKRVWRHVRQIVSGGHWTFHSVLESSLNCDPAVLKDVLAEHSRNEHVPGDHPVSAFHRNFGASNGEVSPWNRNAAERVGSTSNDDATGLGKELASALRQLTTVLPEPTPLYSQWWFSFRTYPRLLSLLRRREGDRWRVAFLGAPTLGAIFSQVSRCDTTILDIDTAVLEQLPSHCSPNTATVQYDARTRPGPGLRGQFHVLFVDPPWGREILRRFLVNASELTCDGGTVAVTFPQLLTRPGMVEERKDLLELANHVGFRVVRMLSGATEYQVPKFERAAYGAIGLSMERPWRRGDLFIFRKTLAPQIEPDRTGPSATVAGLGRAHAPWEQFVCGRQRLFLRRNGSDGSIAPRIHPIDGAPDFVCVSTSSRCDAMKRASLVSTRNGVASTEGEAELSRLLPDMLAKINARYHCGEASPEKKNLIRTLSGLCYEKFR